MEDKHKPYLISYEKTQAIENPSEAKNYILLTYMRCNCLSGVLRGFHKINCG